jgi:hypothetical protein
MVAGVLIAAWGVVTIGMGGESGAPGHAFAGVGILILALGVAVVGASFFVLLPGLGTRRSKRPTP